MLGGINNGLFLQSFGGFVGLALLILVLKWGFSSNRKLIITPIKAGKKDQYGLLKPLPTPSNYIEAQMSLQKLTDANIKATTFVVASVKIGSSTQGLPATFFKETDGSTRLYRCRT